MARTPRRKATSLNAPQTLDQAIAMIARYLEVSANIDQIAADADASIRQIEEARDGFALPLKAELDDLFGQLSRWWAVAAPDLTKDKRRSMEIAGALIGIRTTPPSLKLPKGMKEVDAVSWLQGLRDKIGLIFLRTKTTLDKPALIKELGDEAGATGTMLKLKGFTRASKDEFFIARATAPDTDPEIISQGENA